MMERRKQIFQKYVSCASFIIVALVINLVGCAPSLEQSKTQEAIPTSETPAHAGETGYVLNPGDTISVSFFLFPHLDTTVKIRPDGYISLVPIDDVKAAGLTAQALDEKLTQLYADRIENPELTVTVREFAAQKIYVGGEVRSGGLYDLEFNMSALDAIFRAGGALNTGNLESVIVIRKKIDGTPQIFSINLIKEIKNDLYLRPLDVVYVPQTKIAKVNQFVDQYINKLIPISFNAGFSYVTGTWRPE